MVLVVGLHVQEETMVICSCSRRKLKVGTVGGVGHFLPALPESGPAKNVAVLHQYQLVCHCAWNEVLRDILFLKCCSDSPSRSPKLPSIWLENMSFMVSSSEMKMSGLVVRDESRQSYCAFSNSVSAVSIQTSFLRPSPRVFGTTLLAAAHST